MLSLCRYHSPNVGTVEERQSRPPQVSSLQHCLCLHTKKPNLLREKGRLLNPDIVRSGVVGEELGQGRGELRLCVLVAGAYYNLN